MSASKVSKLDREEIQMILEAEGMEVFDDESTEELRQALKDNLDDGTFDKSCLDGLV